MINTVVVCGAGTMGAGIAETAITKGFHTILYDLREDAVLQAIARIEKNLQQLVVRHKISTEQASTALDLLQGSSDIFYCIGDLVIEAIIEKTDAKSALFNQLAEINHSDTIFASNTSSLSISSIASAVMHPERVCGLHFFNPAPVMKLVELVRGRQTDARVIVELTEFCRKLDKTPVVCKDAPGFIVNRVARHYYLEAMQLVEKGYCSIEDVDALMESCGFRMGPFKLMDLIGNDINFAVTSSLYEATGKAERFRPSPLQEAKLAQRQLGRKTGKGFYNYEDPTQPTT